MMIVKKNSISQDFPALPLLQKHFPFPLSRFCFLDIETNGLSSRHSFLYLIGILEFCDGNFTLTQWMAEGPEEEKKVLEAFAAHLTDCSCLLHFNGDRFDLPFIKARCEHHKMADPLIGKASLDLCKELKKLQPLLKLPNRKYATAEAFLGLTREEDCSGKECIHLYQKYYATGKEAFALPILQHNHLDLAHLPMICELLSYEQILRGSYHLTSITWEEEKLLARFALEYPLPQLISYGSDQVYLTAEGTLLKLLLTPTEGRLKKYYPNVKDYYYLPEEDTAIHKSVGVYVDKSRRQNAVKETCYTWFPITEDFLLKNKQAERYFQENLPCLLGFF